MKKTLVLCAGLTLASTSAYAGGYVEPAPEMPVAVVETRTSSSAGGIIVPLLLVLLIAAAAASN